MNPHFFTVPVRVVSSSSSGYELIFDFASIEVAYSNAVILYQLVEAPPNTQLGVPISNKPGPFDTFVAFNGMLAGMMDTDTDTDSASTTYQITLTAIVTESSGPTLVTSDPQVINNPIKR